MIGHILPLSMLPSGKNASIRRLAEGEKVRERLMSMGFIPGIDVSVVRNDRHGPLIISLLNSRVIIGRGMAQKILVEEYVD